MLKLVSPMATEAGEAGGGSEAEAEGGGGEAKGGGGEADGDGGGASTSRAALRLKQR